MTENPSEAVSRAERALATARRERRPPSELRRLWRELERALDDGVTAAAGSGHQSRHQARTQRELHRLAALSSPGLLLPTVVRTASRAGTGPHIAGMVLDPTPPVAPRGEGTYGLDLAAALEGAPRAATAVQIPVQRAAVEAAAVSVT